MIVSDFIFNMIKSHKKIYSLNKNVFQFDIKTSIEVNMGYGILKNKSFELTKIPFWAYNFNTKEI